MSRAGRSGSALVLLVSALAIGCPSERRSGSQESPELLPLVRASDSTAHVVTVLDTASVSPHRSLILAAVRDSARQSHHTALLLRERSAAPRTWLLHLTDHKLWEHRGALEDVAADSAIVCRVGRAHGAPSRFRPPGTIPS